MPKKLEVLPGTRFARLTVLKETERIYTTGKPERMFLCLCDCGSTKTIRLGSLRFGAAKSCGCFNGPVSERGRNKPEDIEGAVWFPLAKNKWMLIDPEDIEFFKNKRLSVTKLGYAGWNGYVNGVYTRLTAHRAILGLTHGDGRIVDHKNRNKLDNRRCNLRICTAAQNAVNKVASSKRRYRGVATHGRKWRADISYKNEKYSLGVFETQEDAAKAYDQKAKQLHGEFAILNFPESSKT